MLGQCVSRSYVRRLHVTTSSPYLCCIRLVHTAGLWPSTLCQLDTLFRQKLSRCNAIASFFHAEGPGFKSQWVHAIARSFQWGSNPRPYVTAASCDRATPLHSYMFPRCLSTAFFPITFRCFVKTMLGGSVCLLVCMRACLSSYCDARWLKLPSLLCFPVACRPRPRLGRRKSAQQRTKDLELASLVQRPRALR